MWNLNDYETVEERLEKFWKDNPNGRIETDPLEQSVSRFIVKAWIYRDASDDKAWTTGLAEETVSARGVNQTSALENCETSAIGRALANAGYAAKGKRASREEMAKVSARKTETIQVEKADDPWTTVEKPVPVEVSPADMVAAAFQDAEAVPNCDRHGKPMVLKEGLDKNSRPYHGYVCSDWRTSDRLPKEQQCPAKWYVLDKLNGKWKPQGAK